MSSPSAEPGPASSYSAAGPALGYLAQIEYALLLLIQRMDFEEESELSIEALDDVAFHSADGSAVEQIQTKHHINRSARLTDASADLWKTLHNWIDEPSRDPNARLVLMTTAEAAPGSISSLLRGDQSRDVAGALAGLNLTSSTSGNRDNQKYYTAYNEMSPDAKYGLLSRVYIVDKAANASETDSSLRMALRRSVTKDRRNALIDRLRGWWYQRALAHLDAVARGERSRILASELEDVILSIAGTLHDENLPVDYEQEPYPEEFDVSTDDRVFIAQLKLIAMGSARMRLCIYDHNRAFMQRSRWQRDRLLHIGELTAYDARLKDEWRRHFIPLAEDEEDESEAEACNRALQAHGRLYSSQLPPIRPQVQAGYVAAGSLHILADRLEIGWHPKWLDHLKDRIKEIRDADSIEEIA